MSTHDVKLLRLLDDKSFYSRFKPYIKEHSLSKAGWVLVQAVGKYYDSYPTASGFTWSDMRMFFFMLHSKAKPEDHVLYTALFDAIDKEIASPVDSTVIDAVMNHLVKVDYATRVFDKAHAILTRDDGTLDEVEDLVHKYRAEVGSAVNKDDLFVPCSLSRVAAVSAAPGYNWRLGELNASLGPLRPGNFVIFAARPETGKTTMLASEATFLGTQVPDDRPIVWVNNEEPSYTVMHRVIQSHFGITKADLEADMAKYEAKYNAELGNRIRIVDDDMDMNSVSKLDALFADINPSIIIFDQLDKVEGFYKEQRDDLRIGRIYLWARRLAKKYGPVITASQVDGTGEGQEWIYMNQLRGSKTDKVGEADAIVTIGRSNDPSKEYHRYIHVPKNKLHGGVVSKEEHRHGYFEVLIKPTIARYEGSL